MPVTLRGLGNSNPFYGIKGVYCISSSSTCIKTSTGGNFFIFKERFLIFLHFH